MLKLKHRSITTLRLILAVLMVVSVITALGCSSSPPRAIAIVFIDVASIEGHFIQLCLAGAENARQQLGIEYDYQAGDTPAEWESLHREYAESGDYLLIIGVGGAQGDVIAGVAADYPDQKFALIDGAVDGRPNVASYSFRDDESCFLAGALAAMVSGTGQIGFIGGMDIPVIHRFLNGYEAGAKHIDPHCEVLVSYADTWSEVETTKELALAQIDQGADIVFAAAGSSSQGVIEAAKDSGLYAVGVDADQRHLGPDNVLVSVLKHIDVAVYTVIEETLSGDFAPGLRWLGLKEGVVDISLDNALPVVTGEMKSAIEEIRAEIVAGQIEVS